MRATPKSTNIHNLPGSIAQLPVRTLPLLKAVSGRNLLVSGRNLLVSGHNLIVRYLIAILCRLLVTVRWSWSFACGSCFTAAVSILPGHRISW